MKRAFLVALLASYLGAYSDFDIAAAIKNGAKEANIDMRVLYTIAKIESGFKPYIISFTAKRRDFRFDNAAVSVKKYRDKYLINISSPNRANLVKIGERLIDMGYKIDVGLMQINSVNFAKNELNDMFDIDKNIQKSAQVLSWCGAYYKNVKNTIECYNKGLKQGSKLGYFARFKSSFNKDFAGVLG